ncbi:MAG: hypothetical protein AAF789_06740 [Bacteroidota bacterium]
MNTVPGLNGTVDFTLVDAPISELLRAVAETHNLNVSFKDLPRVQITNNFTNVKVKDLLVFLCEEYQLNIRFTNNIFTFYLDVPYVAPDEVVVYEDSLLTIDASNNNLGQISKEISMSSGYNIVVNQAVLNQQVSGYVNRLTVAEALTNFAAANNLLLTQSGGKVFQINPAQQPQASQSFTNRGNQSRRANTGQSFASQYSMQTFKNGPFHYISINSDLAPVGPLVKEAFKRLQLDYIMVKEAAGQLDCKLDSVLFEDFLGVALESSNQTFSIENGIYLIGERGSLLDEAKVYSFQNRSVEGIMDIIPTGLQQSVQIKPFNDLNALILTGSEQSINNVESFLKQIDKPVPNVLIEVIVVDIRDSYSINTGIQAFLADSVPNTSGQVLGGVDLTLSSNTLNRFLNNLDGRGGMNLGRVTPNFYATLKAMENNSDLKIRSTPKVSTLNGHEASLTIGQSVFYLIETQNVTGGVNPIVTVTPRYERVEANLDIKINPFVSDTEDITLNIEAEFSDFIPPTVTGAPPGNATRKLISKIRVKNEETIVVGGLEEASKTESGSGVPILSRIPILKWFFSSQTKEDIKTKLLIFIKPTIVY